ncbi:recombinase family protein [Ligilactobacillus salivarius]
MIFGYARVSTPQQSLDEQIEKLRRAGAEKIYIDCCHKNSN